jgi:1-acyl-sn-glycerol-3-phosphate acyltransferase
MDPTSLGLVVKPPKARVVRRRIITICIYAASWLLLVLLSPLWIPLGILIGLARRRSFVLLRLLLFGCFYLGFELMALVLIAGVFLLYRADARASALYRLQAWWATINLKVAQRLLGLEIVVEGAENAVPGPSILLIRHASILDTLLPCVFVQRPYGLRVRYVLKQELLFDPCIDLVGNALPNYFVDRTGDTPKELEGLRALVSNIGTDSVLIFPEGTRFSDEKRRRALEKLKSQGSPLCDSAHALTRVLPPKPGGVLTLLDALPGIDCVFFAHTGLESFAKIKDLLSGEVVGSKVRIRLWRVSSQEIPAETDRRLRWLYSQWSKIDAHVKDRNAES